MLASYASCDFCRPVKPLYMPLVGLLQPLPVSWDSVSMDVLESIPQTAAGFSAVAICVARLSTMVRLAPCCAVNTAVQSPGLLNADAIK